MIFNIVFAFMILPWFTKHYGDTAGAKRATHLSHSFATNKKVNDYRKMKGWD